MNMYTLQNASVIRQRGSDKLNTLNHHLILGLIVAFWNLGGHPGRHFLNELCVILLIYIIIMRHSWHPYPFSFIVVVLVPRLKDKRDL